jgi:hypothetical protein
VTDARLVALGRALNASSACITHGDVYIAKDCPGCEGRLQSILDAMPGWTVVPDDALGEDNLTIHLLEAKIEQLRSALGAAQETICKPFYPGHAPGCPDAALAP